MCMHAAHVLLRQTRGRPWKTKQGERGCCVLQNRVSQKVQERQKGQGGTRQVKLPKQRLELFCFCLESNSKTKRDIGSLLWAKQTFTNPPATTKSINLYILLWLIRVTRATNSCWLLEVVVERLDFFVYFFLLFSLSGFYFTIWGRCLFKKKWKTHKAIWWKQVVSTELLFES